MCRPLCFVTLMSAAILAACTNAEIGSSKDVSDSAVYADYKIWGEEDKGVVHVLLQYRMGGEDGTTLVLEDPGSVTFDGQPLKVDSAGISGAYYEAAFPLNSFTGKHSIVYTASNGQVHTQHFNFSPISLKTSLDKGVPMKPLVVQMEGLESDRLRLVMTDTAFNTNDVNELVQVKDGALTITSEMWAHLKPGPIVLEIYLEEEKPLTGFSKQGGSIMISYGLKREFMAVPAAK